MASAELLLLHGALYESRVFNPLLERLRERECEAIAFDLPGHGTADFPEDAFSIEHFGRFVLEELNRRDIERVVIFGYSMGGYIALWLARHYPERVASLLTLGTKMAWTREGAAREVEMLDADLIESKVPAFGETLRGRHGADRYRELLARTATMMTNLGAAPEVTPEDLEQISQPVRMMVGDRDRMVSIEETADAYRHLQNGELAVLPSTHHPLERADATMLARVIAAHYLRNRFDTV